MGLWPHRPLKGPATSMQSHWGIKPQMSLGGANHIYITALD